MLRSIGAVVAGYAVMVVIVMAGTLALVQALVPGGIGAMRGRGQADAMVVTPASSAYLGANIALSFAAAVAGGWVTLRIAHGAHTEHLAALCAVIAVMGFISARSPKSGPQPRWYPLAIPIIGILGVALSSLLVRATQV